MKNRKLKKYIKKVIEPLESEDFLMLFTKCSVLGYSTTTLGVEDYRVLKTILTDMIYAIDKEPKYKELFLSDDGLLFPYDEDNWVRISMLNNNPLGLTFYLDNSYKLFLFENEKLVTFNKVATTSVRDSQFIAENLSLA